VTGRDPFGTASVRERVLAAWAASPARLREDANAEEDFSLGGYRDRVVVELAQNAADAAAEAGEPGRLRLSLTASDDGEVLAAANTGAPLDAAGVAALATLRASAKRDEQDGRTAAHSVGRFGVGFAAVLSLTDEPILLSRNGSVRFSRADTVQLVLDVPELADEVRRRDGHLPALRLPFEAEGEPPHGFSTVVLLPLRDEGAAGLARRLLADLDDAVLLALPGLDEIEIEVDGAVRVLRDAGSRWFTAARSGTFSPPEQRDLYADRPTEEAHRPWWSVLWAVPASPDIGVPQVLHAPTPTDEPMAWPALLLASFPLEPSRRHVAPGPLTDRLVSEAASTYADLLTERAALALDLLPLVPIGLGAGALDAALRLATLAALRDAPILRTVEDGSAVRPRDAVVIDGTPGSAPEVLTALAPFVAGLVDAPPSGRTALRQLGVQQVGLSEVIEALPPAADPEEWASRYAALAAVGEQPDGREALGVLPVPLADGRVVRGARGLLLPPESMSADVLEPLAAAGVRLVHRAAVHPLLIRLGALPATPRQILEDPAVRELVMTSPDAEDPDAVAATVLGLVAAAVADDALRPGDLPWLGDLALPDVEDELSPAAALALPDSLAARLLDPDEIGLVAGDWLDRFGGPALAALGVLADLAPVTGDDVDLLDPMEELAELDGFADWATWAATESGAGSGPIAGAVVAVRDLDVLRPDAWADAVRAIAAEPATRPALVQPVRVRDERGRGGDVAPYTSWWLRRELGLDARVDPGGDPVLVALLDPAPDWVAGLDDEVRRALGVVSGLADLGAEATALLVERQARPDRSVDLAGMLRLWAWLASMSEDADVVPPGMVRALTPSGVDLVASSTAMVVDEPMWLQRKDLGPFVISPAGRAGALADVLDLDLAGDRAPGAVTSTGRSEPLPAAVLDVVTDSPIDWCRHDRLEVDGVPVGWWVDGDGALHAGGPNGLATALAWASGQWRRRFLLAALLAEPDRGPELLADAAFDSATTAY
jgi:hypothetical protein